MSARHILGLREITGRPQAAPPSPTYGYPGPGGGGIIGNGAGAVGPSNAGIREALTGILDGATLTLNENRVS